MFKQLIVKNFRCFGSLHLRDLARVNLIAGKNNTGKTALLEAIHLHNNPSDLELPIDINGHRGLTRTDASDAGVDEWLFYGKYGHVGFEVWTQDERGIDRTLSMRFVSAAELRQQNPILEMEIQSSFRSDVANNDTRRRIAKFEQSGKPPQYSVAFQAGVGAFGLRAPVEWHTISVFVGIATAARELDIRLFGQLEIAKRQDEILPALRLLEPRLQRLSLIPFGKIAVIHGDIGLPLLVPLHFMGEGTRRLLSVLLAIATAKDGVLLVDEIENGFHHSVHKDVWKAISTAARENNVQVFATTHSWECMKAAHEAFSEGTEYDFAIHRLQRTSSDISVVTYDQKHIDSALFNAVEMR